MKDAGLDRRLRLCVVQLDGIPRARSGRYDLWIPAEPLVDLRDSAKLSSSLPRLSTQRLFAAEKNEVYKKIHEQSEAAAASHLEEILAYLHGHDVDVAVFPEYLTPVKCLPALVEFSRGRAVVAGLEYVRGRAQAEYLARNSDGSEKPEDLIQRNVSVLVADGRIYLISKKLYSTGEVIRQGTGPIVEEVRLRGRIVNLGVAVCMDYLRAEEDARVRKPDILCIPAYSHGLKPFRPDEPRDYVRLFSNGAVYGGSQIMIPALPGLMVSDLGVEPIRPGFEAVILIAYDRYPQRPTGLLGTDNELLLRAEIIEKTAANGAALNAIEDLAAYATANDLPIAQLQEKLTMWLGQIPAGSPMGEIFAVYRDFLAQDFEDARVDKLARSHLTVESGNRPIAIRRAQAEYIISQLPTLTSGNKPLGEAADAYSMLLTEPVEIALNTATLHAPAHAASSGSSAETPETIARTAASGSASPEISDISRTPRSATGVFIGPKLFEPLDLASGFRPVEAERLRICQGIETGTQGILNAMSDLTASASPDDLQSAAQACRFRVAAVADLLAKLTNLTPTHSDIDWIDAIGVVEANLAQLQKKLPSDFNAAQRVMTWNAGLSPFVEMATVLHESTISLRRLAE